MSFSIKKDMYVCRFRKDEEIHKFYFFVSFGDDIEFVASEECKKRFGFELPASNIIYRHRSKV